MVWSVWRESRELWTLQSSCLPGTNVRYVENCAAYLENPFGPAQPPQYNERRVARVFKSEEAGP